MRFPTILPAQFTSVCNGVFNTKAAEIQHHLHLLQVLKPFVTLLYGEDSLDTIGELSVALLKTPSFDLAAQHLQRDPAAAALIQERYLAPPHDLDALLQYPQDSLGYIYAAQMKAQGFDPDLYSHLKVDSDASYVEARLGQTHDIWHTVTGFKTSAIDEIGLQAFHLPQLPYPLATMLIANSLMASTFFEPAELPQLLNAIAQGWEMGKAAKCLFAQKWEQSWDKPLSQWQAELGIQPIVYEDIQHQDEERSPDFN